MPDNSRASTNNKAVTFLPHHTHESKQIRSIPLMTAGKENKQDRVVIVIITNTGDAKLKTCKQRTDTPGFNEGAYRSHFLTASMRCSLKARPDLISTNLSIVKLNFLSVPVMLRLLPLKLITFN